jgi:hypothetical protein
VNREGHPHEGHRDEDEASSENEPKAGHDPVLWARNCEGNDDGEGGEESANAGEQRLCTVSAVLAKCSEDGKSNLRLLPCITDGPPYILRARRGLASVGQKATYLVGRRA